MYSGLQPAMTPMVAIFSTVAVRFMGRNTTGSPFLPVRPIWIDRSRRMVVLESDEFVRLVAGALEHFGDALFGGDTYGKAVGILGRWGRSGGWE